MEIQSPVRWKFQFWIRWKFHFGSDRNSIFGSDRNSIFGPIGIPFLDPTEIPDFRSGLKEFRIPLYSLFPLKDTMDNRRPVHVKGIPKDILNTKDLVDGIKWGDVGLQRIQTIVRQWINSGTRNINQYTFKDVEIGSDFTLDELKSFATYMWSIYYATVRGSPNDQYPVERCWISTAGALQPSGRHRISYQNNYYLNYQFNATVILGPATHEWSHLCCNKLCERVSHLCDEDHTTNIAREKCPGIMYCPNTERIWILCNHQPRCKHVHLAVNGPMTITEYRQQQ
jgi:hypothetical protein